MKGKLYPFGKKVTNKPDFSFGKPLKSSKK
jgi:hypothetical protein